MICMTFEIIPPSFRKEVSQLHPGNFLEKLIFRETDLFSFTPLVWTQGKTINHRCSLAMGRAAFGGHDDPDFGSAKSRAHTLAGKLQRDL